MICEVYTENSKRPNVEHCGTPLTTSKRTGAALHTLCELK